MSKIIYCIFIVVFFANCSSEPDKSIPTPAETLYFPPLSGDAWETKSITDLGWKQSAVQPLLDYLALKNSKSFIILVDGRIVLGIISTDIQQLRPGIGQVPEKH